MDNFSKELEKCPLNTPVLLFAEYMMYQYIFIGTLTINQYDGSITRGQCIKGDPEVFYRSAIKGWKKIDE